MAVGDKWVLTEWSQEEGQAREDGDVFPCEGAPDGGGQPGPRWEGFAVVRDSS